MPRRRAISRSDTPWALSTWICIHCSFWSIASLCAQKADCTERWLRFTSREVAHYYFAPNSLEHEVFAVLFLDTQHRLIEYSELFRGTIDSASVYPREVLKEALRLNAAAVIVSHNHPSGNPEPSAADKSLTKRLREALAMVDVRVLDHIIVGGTETTSFAEQGLL